MRFHLTSSPQPEEANGHLSGDILISSVAGTPLEARLVSFLAQELAAWSGNSELQFTQSYGPRTYTRGSTLAAHGDRPHTHALSAIVFVDAVGLEAPWPLQFVPVGAAAEARVQDIFLSATADVLLYESLQPHGRVLPLRGESFSALFLHWRPPEWSRQVSELLGEE